MAEGRGLARFWRGLPRPWPTLAMADLGQAAPGRGRRYLKKIIKKIKKKKLQQRKGQAPQGGGPTSSALAHLGQAEPSARPGAETGLGHGRGLASASARPGAGLAMAKGRGLARFWRGLPRPWPTSARQRLAEEEDIFFKK